MKGGNFLKQEKAEQIVTMHGTNERFRVITKKKMFRILEKKYPSTQKRKSETMNVSKKVNLDNRKTRVNEGKVLE